jgi:hypothetical protein
MAVVTFLSPGASRETLFQNRSRSVGILPVWGGLEAASCEESDSDAGQNPGYTNADDDCPELGVRPTESISEPYHGSFDAPENSLTREYGDGSEVDNFFSHDATTRVNRAYGEQALLGLAAIRAHELNDAYAPLPICIGAAR